MYHGLRTDGRKIGLRAVASADFDEGEIGVTGGDGLEGEGAEAACSADSGGVGWTDGRDGDEALVFAVNERDCLVDQEVRKQCPNWRYREPIATDLPDGRLEVHGICRH